MRTCYGLSRRAGSVRAAVGEENSWAVRCQTQRIRAAMNALVMALVVCLKCVLEGLLGGCWLLGSRFRQRNVGGDGPGTSHMLRLHTVPPQCPPRSALALPSCPLFENQHFIAAGEPSAALEIMAERPPRRTGPGFCTSPPSEHAAQRASFFPPHSHLSRDRDLETIPFLLDNPRCAAFLKELVAASDPVRRVWLLARAFETD